VGSLARRTRLTRRSTLEDPETFSFLFRPPKQVPGTRLLEPVWYTKQNPSGRIPAWQRLEMCARFRLMFCLDAPTFLDRTANAFLRAALAKPGRAPVECPEYLLAASGTLARDRFALASEQLSPMSVGPFQLFAIDLETMNA